MIFDSPRMAELRQKYRHTPNDKAPRIVRLGRRRDLAAERRDLEATLQCATGSKRSEWLRRLLNVDEGQHFAAWFEMMLCGWLQKVAHVEIAPVIEGCNPDFAINAGGRRIVIEAEALTMGQKGRQREAFICELISLLSAASGRYEVLLWKVEAKALHPDQELADKILQALQQACGSVDPSSPDEDIFPDYEPSSHCGPIFIDSPRAKVAILVRRHETLQGTVAYPSTIEFMDSSRVWDGLSDKVEQHRAIREAGHPYIVALLLDTESMRLDVEAAIEASFGRLQALMRSDAAGVIRIQRDLSGLLCGNDGIPRRDVSGIVVFEAKLCVARRQRVLKAWYVCNPYATELVDGSLFPTEDRLVVLEQGPGGYCLGWAGREGQSFWLPRDGRVTGRQG